MPSRRNLAVILMLSGILAAAGPVVFNASLFAWIVATVLIADILLLWHVQEERIARLHGQYDLLQDSNVRLNRENQLLQDEQPERLM